MVSIPSTYVVINMGFLYVDNIFGPQKQCLSFNIYNSRVMLKEISENEIFSQEKMRNDL